MDATCKVQDNIHVFRLVHNMCPGFWVHIILNLGDFFLLDCLLFQGKYKDKIVIPGTEGHLDYEFGNWMKHLAIMEHFVLTPFLIIPFVAVIQALIVGLLGR